MADTTGERKATTQLWKTFDAAANKSGPRRAVYWVKHNPKFQESQRLGLKPKDSRYLTGDRYVGDWQNNVRHGYGTLTRDNGEVYEGEWEAGKRHGKGTLLVSKRGKLRKRYTGDWANNKHHGMGVYFYENGAKYEGHWHEGARHGTGKMVYANGDVYDGDWKQDQRAGLGVLRLVNGDCYEGHWLADKKEGPGRYFYMSTRKMYEGEWADDVAKCGVFSDIPFESAADAAVGGRTFTIPDLGLERAEDVVIDAIESVRVVRSAATMSVTEAGAAAEGGASDSARAARTIEDLTEHEIELLMSAFEAADPDRTGVMLGADLPVALHQLGISPSQQDLEGLLEELGASIDSEITFDAFADCMARLKE